jgi:hypothetical protein
MTGYSMNVGLVNGGGHLVFRLFGNRTDYQMLVRLLGWTVLFKKEKFSSY